MKTRKVVMLGAVLLACAGTTLEAAPPAGDGAAAEKNGTKPPESKAVPFEIKSLSPMHQEFRQLFETERERIQELNRRSIQATLPSEKIAIQKEIETIKKGSQIAVLEIQLRYARSEDRPAATKQLEAAIETLRHPKPVKGTRVPLVEQSAAPGK